MKKSRFLLVSLVSVLILSFLLAGCSSPAPATTQAPAPSTAKPTTAAPAPSPSATAKPTTAPAPANVIKWKMQSTYELATVNARFHAIAWANWVKDITNGRLQIDVNPPGTFAKGTEQMTAVSKGVFDASLDYAGYYGANIPVTKVESGLPLAWSTFGDIYDAFYKRGLFDLLKDVYAQKNLKVLAVMAPVYGYNFETNFPFTGLDSIKGKKIRATGIYADYVQALGGVPVNIPSGDMYMAAKTGLIQGAIQGLTSLQTLKLAEVFQDYVLTPSLGLASTVGPAINMQSWNALPDDIKHILEEGTKDRYLEGHYECYLETVGTIKWATDNYKTRFLSYSDADMARATDICLKLWDAVAKEDATCAKAVAIVKQQMKDYGKVK